MAESAESSTEDVTGSDQGSSGSYLQIEGLRKVFEDDHGGEVVAVENFNLDVSDGEFIVFVGPSGCGKTTTLRMIAGLEEPTEGKLLLNGRDIKDERARERDVAMVFQTYALYPHMSVEENMEYPLKVRGYEKDYRKQRVQNTAELLQIDELLDRKPSDLSGGQQQRVALGRAIVREPKIFLLDEPLSNLDQKLRVSMRTELNKLHNKIGKTSIYVTHDQAEAMTLGDRIVVMRDGEIQQTAPPQEIYHNPVNQFVGQFIGEPKMNFFEGVVATSDNERIIETDAFTIPVTQEMDDVLESYTGDSIVFGIRPEHFHYESPEYRGGHSFTSEVTVVENMGSDKHLTIEAGDTEFKAIIDGKTDVERGEQIQLQMELANSHLFDPNSGDSLFY